MQYSNLPVKMTVTWAAGAGSSYVRQVPTPSQAATSTDAPASFTDGFPPLTFVNRSSGGIPPNGADFNGILAQITEWNQWQQAGGSVQFDGTFSSAVGGYPNGAILQSSVTAGLYWLNTVDNNTTNPDGDSAANWIALIGVASRVNAAAGSRVYADGLKECWGSVSVPANGTASVTLPVTHTAWFNVVLGAQVKNTSSANNNTGLLQKNSLTGFTLVNWENINLQVDWMTRGV